MIIVGDTSGLVAALNPSDPQHTGARTALQLAALTVVSPLVVHEIEHITTRSINRRAAYAVNDWLLAQEIAGRIEVPAISADLLRSARRVQNRYLALRLDLTDAVNVLLAERYDTADLLTLDRRDFRTITPLMTHPAFRLLPDDL